MSLMVLISLALATAFLTAPGIPSAQLLGLAVIATLVSLYWLLGNIFYPLLVKLGWIAK